MISRPLALALAAAAFVLLALPASAAANNCEGVIASDSSPDCGGVPAPPSPSPPPSPPPGTSPPPPNQPFGWIDGVDAAGDARGWACDADDFATPLVVHFYVNGPAGLGVFAGSAVAGQQREQAVGDLCGGNRFHGFAFRVPDAYRNGAGHTLYAYALNIGAGDHQLLFGSPKWFALSQSPQDPSPGGWTFEDESFEYFEPTTTTPCKRVLYRRTGRSLPLWHVLFRMNLQLRWCWEGARIVEATAICWSSDVSIAVQAGPCPRPQGQHFPTRYDVRGGWHAVAENTYRNCLPDPFGKLTCWRQAIVTLQIHAHAGGLWKGSGGDR